MNKKFIQQIDFFSQLSEEKLEIVLNAFEAKNFQKNDLIMNQGDVGDGMYVIIFGEVDVIRDNKVIAQLKNEDFFGELALVANEPRSATIKATSDNLSTFFLSKAGFDQIKDELGDESRQEILKRITENYA